LKTIVFIDGLAEPTNPGTGTFGYVIYRGEKKAVEECGLAGANVTNNFAEYHALVMALRKLKAKRWMDDVTVRSDSKLLIGQMSQGWKVKGGGYIQEYKAARDLASEFPPLRFEWIPRELNKEADLLSRIAYSKNKSSVGRKMDDEG
jgi:ribonuclease HI